MILKFDGLVVLSVCSSIPLWCSPIWLILSASTYKNCCCKRSVASFTLPQNLVTVIKIDQLLYSQAFVPSDLAEIIMANWRMSNASDQHEFPCAENALPASESEKNKHVAVYREMLLTGATKVMLAFYFQLLILIFPKKKLVCLTCGVWVTRVCLLGSQSPNWVTIP